jgi:RNA-binding protein YlmH
MDLFQHFHPEERPFVEQVLEWQRIILERYSLKLTDYLDPRQQDILRLLSSKHSDIKVYFSGGFTNAERKRAVIAPEYYELNEEDFNIQVYQLQYPDKFVTLEHRDVLGSLMNLGLKREKFGDILIAQGRIQISLAKEISDYVQMELKKVGNATVTIEPISTTQYLKVLESWEESEGSVSSLRLDVILAEIFNQSRSKVIPHIKGGNVKVNWQAIEQVSHELKVGDYLSLRGYGRAKLLEILGQTKRDKWRIRYGRKK